MNKNIIIAILAIVIIAAAAFMFFGHPADGKVNTQINFVSGTSLQNGDHNTHLMELLRAFGEGA